MNAKGMVFFATVVATMFGLFGTPGKAAAVNSGIAIDTTYHVDTQVNPPPMPPTYTITVTGTVTLGTTDSWAGINVSFVDPANNVYYPTTTFTRPAPGATTAWSAKYVTQTGGKGWTAGATMFYMNNLNQAKSVNAVPILTFNVPPP